jgi:hypothetical protein
MEASEPHGAVQLARTYFLSNGGAATRARTFDWDGQEEEVCGTMTMCTAQHPHLTPPLRPLILHFCVQNIYSEKYPVRACAFTCTQLNIHIGVCQL